MTREVLTEQQKWKPDWNGACRKWGSGSSRQLLLGGLILRLPTLEQKVERDVKSREVEIYE